MGCKDIGPFILSRLSTPTCSGCVCDYYHNSKYRPFFRRGNPSYFRFTMQEIGLCAQIIGHKDAVRLEEKSEEQVRCGVFLDPTESLYLMATGGQVPLCVAYELG